VPIEPEQAGRIRQQTVLESDAFRAQQPQLPRHLGTVHMPAESTGGEVRGDNAVAGDFWRKRIAHERLSNGLA